MSLRRRLKNFRDWCPQPPTRLPVKLRYYSISFAAVLVAVIALGVFLSVPFFQSVPIKPVPQLPQILSENTTQPSPMPIPTVTASPAPTLAPTQTPLPVYTQLPIYTPLPGTPINDCFKLSMSTEKTVFNLGEPVNLVLTITNISNQTVNFTRTAMNFDFNVTDGHYIIYRWSVTHLSPQWAMLIQLEPGQNITESYIWPQISSLTPITGGVSVSPGTYWIIGKTDRSIGLLTDPLEITIESVS